MSARIGLIGGRGYTGEELLGLLARHPDMELAFASSATMAGTAVKASCPAWPDADTAFIGLESGQAGQVEADAWVLAVPNGSAAAWAESIRRAHADAVVLDLSADHRFDPRWTYGLPEHHRDLIRSARRIANPGCYATAGQMALWPLKGRFVGTPVIFGVSGYSGAGKTPSDKNDPGRLADNLLPYTLTGHVHEREIGARLGCDVRFMPHVAPFFRGIALTVSAQLDRPATRDGLLDLFNEAYLDEPRVVIRADIPEVAQVRQTPDIHIGGFAVDVRDATRVTIVAVLDNLSKGAASQALQNLNLALGLDEHAGLES